MLSADLSKSFFQLIVSMFIFSQYFSSRFYPVKKCGVNPHCLCRDSLTLFKPIQQIFSNDGKCNVKKSTHWSKDETNILIEVYKEYEKSLRTKKIKKDIWIKIKQDNDMKCNQNEISSAKGISQIQERIIIQRVDVLARIQNILVTLMKHWGVGMLFQQNIRWALVMIQKQKKIRKKQKKWCLLKKMKLKSVNILLSLSEDYKINLH